MCTACFVKSGHTYKHNEKSWLGILSHNSKSQLGIIAVGLIMSWSLVFFSRRQRSNVVQSSSRNDLDHLHHACLHVIIPFIFIMQWSCSSSSRVPSHRYLINLHHGCLIMSWSAAMKIESWSAAMKIVRSSSSHASSIRLRVGRRISCRSPWFE